MTPRHQKCIGARETEGGHRAAQAKAVHSTAEERPDYARGEKHEQILPAGERALQFGAQKPYEEGGKHESQQASRRHDRQQDQ